MKEISADGRGEFSAGRPGVVVIGLGNPSRGDDAIGLAVVGKVKARAPEEVATVEVNGDGALLIDAWAGARAAILVDAVVSGARPGAIHRFDALTEALPDSPPSPSTHTFGVAQAIALSRALGLLPPRLIFYGVEAGAFGAEEEISEAAKAAVDELVESILEEAARH